MSRGVYSDKRKDAVLTPDNTFLVQEIIDDFDAIPHLSLCPFRHGNDGPADFTRFNVIERWDSFGPALLKLLSVASHALPPTYDPSNGPFRNCHASPTTPGVLIA